MNKRLDLQDELKSLGYRLVPADRPEAEFWMKSNDQASRAVIIEDGDNLYIDFFEVNLKYVSR